MNQILYTNSDNSNNHLSYIELKKFNFFRLSFLISFILFLISIIFLIYINFDKKESESLSDKIIDKYNVSRLYNESENSSQNSILYNNNEIIGFIEIPNINIYYPIFANINDDLLKISPCRFSGPLPNNIGNLCIAGHNYDNNKFFSKISSLKNNDIIYVYDISNKKLAYNVFANYEVNSNDLSPTIENNSNIRELTLVTCNNYNSNRIIIKAKNENL